MFLLDEPHHQARRGNHFRQRGEVEDRVRVSDGETDVVVEPPKRLLPQHPIARSHFHDRGRISTLIDPRWTISAALAKGCIRDRLNVTALFRLSYENRMMPSAPSCLRGSNVVDRRRRGELIRADAGPHGVLSRELFDVRDLRPEHGGICRIRHRANGIEQSCSPASDPIPESVWWSLPSRPETRRRSALRGSSGFYRRPNLRHSAVSRCAPKFLPPLREHLSVEQRTLACPPGILTALGRREPRIDVRPKLVERLRRCSRIRHWESGCSPDEYRPPRNAMRCRRSLS